MTRASKAKSESLTNPTISSGFMPVTQWRLRQKKNGERDIVGHGLWMCVVEAQESACCDSSKAIKLEDCKDKQYGTATPHTIDTNSFGN